MTPPVTSSSSLPYLFFFSYARYDRNKYLERFFEDLVEKVGRKAARSGVSFRDLPRIEPGDDWEAELVDALQTSQTLLCIYTPYYFNREYCGKEFGIFVQRQGVSLDENGVVRGSNRIIPVLWMKESDLQRHGFPPSALQAIQYSVTQHIDVYRAKGLEGILRETGRRGPYQTILEELSELIVNRSTPLLAALPHPPTLGKAPNIFAVTPAPVSRPTHGGPHVLRAFHLLAGTEAGAPETESAVSPEAAIADVGFELGMTCVHQTVNASVGDAGAELLAALLDATSRNEVVVVTATSSRDALLQRLMEGLLASGGWRGALVILPGTSARAAASFASRLGDAAAGDDVIVTAALGSAAELHSVLRRLVEGLQRRIVATGDLRRLLAERGPERRPLVSGPRENLRNVA